MELLGHASVHVNRGIILLPFLSAPEAPEPPRRLRTHGSIGNSRHGTTGGVLRSTSEATATSLAAMRGPGGGRPRRGNDKRTAMAAMPSGQVARGGADGWGERSTRATPDRGQKKS